MTRLSDAFDTRIFTTRLLQLCGLALFVAACAASPEEERLAFLVSNPMASASLSFAEPSVSFEILGDSDPFIGSAEGSQVLIQWELDGSQVRPGVQELLIQAEASGFMMERRSENPDGPFYRGFDQDRVLLTIAGVVRGPESLPLVSGVSVVLR